MLTRAHYAMALHLCEKGGATVADLLVYATEPTIYAGLRRLRADRIKGKWGEYRYTASAETWRMYRESPPVAAPPVRRWRSATAAVRAILRERNASAAEVAKLTDYHVHTVSKVLRRLAARGEVVLHVAGPKSAWILTRRAA